MESKSASEISALLGSFPYKRNKQSGDFMNSLVQQYSSLFLNPAKGKCTMKVKNFLGGLLFYKIHRSIYRN